LSSGGPDWPHAESRLLIQLASHEAQDFCTRRIDPDQEARRLISRLDALGRKVTLEPAA